MDARGGTASPAAAPPVEASGPLPGRGYLAVRRTDLPDGYVEEEWFLAGTATSYEGTQPLEATGAWSVAPRNRASYRTRVVVRRPADPAACSGTTLVEWLNVTMGGDMPIDWQYAHRHIARRGHVWVGVSCQQVGIDGGGPTPGHHLKRADPERYDVLHHPGDAFSFDVFSQAGRAVRDGSLGALPAQRLIACGHSQSSACMVTYIDAVDPVAGVYDGFLVHGRPGRPLALSGNRLRVDADGPPEPATLGCPGPVAIRADVRVPVLVLQAESDVLVLDSRSVDQPDSPLIREWQVAGAAHGDTYLYASASDRPDTPAHRLAELLAPTDRPFGDAMPFTSPINGSAQQHYVLQAAIERLEAWVRTGEPAPAAPPFGLGADDVQRDAWGIAIGGLRTGWVEAPDAVHSGLGQGGASVTQLFGSSRPFTREQLAQLYPGGRAEHLRRFAAATDAAVRSGHLLADDAEEMIALAGCLWDQAVTRSTGL